MTPRILTIPDKKLIGLQMTMSMTSNKTGMLWGTFGPQIKHIQNRVGSDKISLQVYPPSYHAQFDPNAEFVKWAAAEVSDYSNVPDGLESFDLKGGVYAVFDHVGSSPEATFNVFQYIYGTWVPKSNYELDDRPHFEVLGEKYRNNDPTSEEEIWIPVIGELES